MCGGKVKERKLIKAVGGESSAKWELGARNVCVQAGGVATIMGEAFARPRGGLAQSFHGAKEKVREARMPSET